MRNRAADAEELSSEASPQCLEHLCRAHRQKRISNGEVIEKLQRLGGDWFAPSPVLQVSDSVGRKCTPSSGCFFRLRPFILPTRKLRDAGVESLNRSLVSAVPKLHGPMFGGGGLPLGPLPAVRLPAHHEQNLSHRPRVQPMLR